MKLCRRQLSLFVTLTLCLSGFSLNKAVCQTFEVRGAPTDTTSKVSAPWESQVIDTVIFPKVNLKEVLDELRVEFEGVQFVTNGPVERLTIDIELRSVTLWNILKAIEIQLEGQVKIDTRDKNMVAVYARIPESPKPILRAFSIASYLGTKLNDALERHGEQLEFAEMQKLKEEVMQSAEDEIYETVHRSLTMLTEAREASDPLDLPRLNIHPRTKLMIVVGMPEAVEVVGQIVSALNGQVQTGMGYGGGGGYGGGRGGGLGAVNPSGGR